MRRILPLVLLLACAISGIAQPQGFPPANHEAAPDLVRVAVNWIVLNASVRDRVSNRSINSLQSGDFRIYENEVLQELKETQFTDLPYSLLLLMDVSGSTYPYMKLMKKAATDFLHEIGPNDRIAIASFNSDVRLLQNFTPDITEAAKAIEQLRSGGGTAFYDALLTSVNRYMRRAEGRKAIVVFTDGVDSLLSGDYEAGSSHSYEELLSRVQESDVLIYVIFLNSNGKEMLLFSGGRSPDRPSSFPLPMPIPAQSSFPQLSPAPSPDPSLGSAQNPRTRQEREEDAIYEMAFQQLESLAQFTGGRMYSPKRIEDLSGVYAEVADDLRIQYLLSYASSDACQSPGWHAIRIEVKDHPEAVVRTREGYLVKENGEQ
jgi:VWFA-related protein